MAHPDRMTLADALALEVERREITQTEAATQIGVAQQVLSRWISGENTPKAEYVPAIARFLHISQADVRSMRAQERKPRPGDLARRMDRIETRLGTLEGLVRTLVERQRR